jgi:hypothetical protein
MITDRSQLETPQHWMLAAIHMERSTCRPNIQLEAGNASWSVVAKAMALVAYLQTTSLAHGSSKQAAHVLVKHTPTHPLKAQPLASLAHQQQQQQQQRQQTQRQAEALEKCKEKECAAAR